VMAHLRLNIGELLLSSQIHKYSDVLSLDFWRLER
jgi:hypothetical protein